jgi:hypothetical protein
LAPGHWRDGEAVTQAFGDRWLDTGTELALWVPSHVEPAEHNLIINALHPRPAQWSKRARSAVLVEAPIFMADPLRLKPTGRSLMGWTGTVRQRTEHRPDKAYIESSGVV